MQPVRIRKPARKAWAAAGGVFLLLVAAAAVWLLFPRGTPAGNPASGPREESVTLIDRDAATLLRMEVTASDGSAFALVRQGDSFVVEGDPGFPLEEREVSLMVKDLTLLTAHEEAGEVTPGHDLSPLGITENSPRVRAGYANGESVTLIFGDDAHSDIPADYLMLEGDTKVYLVSKETRDHFDRSLATLHPVPGIRFTPDLLDRMVVAGDGAFTLARRGVLWEITSPVRYPADAGKVSSLLRSVGNMRLAVWAGNAEPGALAGFGLLPDRRTVTFHLGASYITGYDADGNALESEPVAAQDIMLSVGADIGSIGFFALYDGGVYQVSVASMGFLRDTRMESLLARAPVAIPVAMLDKVTVREGDAAREYRVELVESVLPNNDLRTDDAGNVLFDAVITRNGTEDVSEEFLAEYLELMRLSAAGSLPAGYVPSKEAMHEIHLTGPDVALSLAFAEYDALHYAMGVNGHYLFYVDRAAADGIAL